MEAPSNRVILQIFLPNMFNLMLQLFSQNVCKFHRIIVHFPSKNIVPLEQVWCMQSLLKKLETKIFVGILNTGLSE